MRRRHHRRGLGRRLGGAAWRLFQAALVVALLPLALPLAIPFVALSTPDARARVLRDHLP